MNVSGAVVGLSCSVAVMGASGCTAFLPKREAPDEGTVPAHFTLAEAQGTPSNQWWQDFESDELNRLVNEAMTENLTLRQLWARLDQAHSTAVEAAADLYPQLDADAGAGYSRTITTVESDAPSFRTQLGQAAASGITTGVTNSVKGNLTGSASSFGSSTTVSGRIISPKNASSTRVTRETKQFGLSLAASYEVDIWGRIASEYRAADYDVTATRDDLEATAMTLAAEVADRWLRILEQQELHRILNEQLTTNKTYLDLVELRFRKSMVTALDVYQQRQVVSEVQQQIPLVEAQEQVLRHDLAVLLGKLPAAELTIGTYDLAEMPPPPATGLPAELLVYRPDVRAALARLNAADYRVAAARADRLPAIRLTGGIGYDADEIANIFDDWFLNLAGGLTAPLFDGFRRQAEVERTLAVVEERLADYRLTILTAIREVEDALVQERKQREHLDALSQELQDASNTLREAARHYQAGLIDYLPVLDALERTQALTREMVSARRELLVFRINLYRALGGTWTQDLQEPDRLSDRGAVAKDVQS